MSEDIQISDMGYKRWKHQMAELAHSELIVGVLGPAARTAHKDMPPGPPGNSDESDTEATMADVAYWNEFGTEHIPERAVFRNTFEDLKEPLERRMNGAVRQVSEGKSNAKDQLDRVGLWYVGELRQEMIAFDSPGNAESTIEQKHGEDNPWIDTGRMHGSIQHLVQPAGEAD